MLLYIIIYIIYISSITAGDLCSIPSQEDPKGGSGLPTSVFLPGEFHGQRSLAGYIPWGHKELDRTEHTGIKPMSPAWEGGFLPTDHQGIQCSILKMTMPPCEGG